MTAPSLYIRHVRSNVKKGVDCELSRLTLLVGPNGSGKTSVQNAIELAACGFASDVEGRAKVKKGDMLAKLGPATATPLTAEVELSDGRKAKWKLTPNKRGGYHEPEHVAPNDLTVVFPVQEVREILGGSVDTVRMWLMSRVGSTVREADVVDKLPDDVQDVYRDRAKRVRRDGMNEVDVLLAVIEAADKEARALDAESKTAKQVIDTMSEGMGDEPTAGDIEAGEQAVAEAEDRYREAQRSSGQQRPNLEELRLSAVAAVEAFKAAAETARLAFSAVPPLHPQEEALIEFRSKMADICTVTVDVGSKNCLVCDSPLNVGLGHRAALLRRENESGAAAVAARRLAERKQGEADALRGIAEGRVQQYAAAERLVKELGPDPSDALQAIGDDVVKVRSELNEMKLRKRQWTNVRAAKDQVRRNSDAANKLKDLSGACGEVVEALLQQAQKKFETVVQSHLPASDKFALVLTENKKPVCRMGFRRGKTLHTALSGAEWARLTLALGCATFKADATVLAIFTPEERAFDPDTLAAVMNALANAPGQVILQSPNSPSNNYRSEWRVVDLEENTTAGPATVAPVVGEA